MTVRNAKSEDDRIVRFVTIQLFIIFYLQKFDAGPQGSQISLLLVLMAGCLGWQVIIGRMSFSLLRGALYAVFVACCLLSQVMANIIGSPTSMMELFLIYGFMTVTVPISTNTYARILNNVVKLMIVPALIVLVQYGYQTLLGTSDPISMTPIVPKAFLLQGYVYEAHYPWNVPFQRPNGFFFLEPSYVSFFCASAAIIELTYFRRPLLAMLMVGATVLSLGATGITMLIVALPFLIMRQSPKLVMPLIVVGILGLVVVLSAGMDLPLISRMGELDSKDSSGGGRLIVPLETLISILSNPSYLLTGQGAGATTPAMGNPWPVSKIAYEYGIVTMFAYIALLVAMFWGNHNLPLKVAVATIFNFTGGYLLEPPMVQFCALLFCIVMPTRQAHLRPYAPIIRGNARYV